MTSSGQVRTGTARQLSKRAIPAKHPSKTRLETAKTTKPFQGVMGVAIQAISAITATVLKPVRIACFVIGENFSDFD
jgi:hypothetical protein